MNTKSSQLERSKPCRSFAATVAALAIGAAALALPQQRTLAQTTTTTAPEGEPVITASAKPAHSVDVMVGESRTIDAAWPVKRVSVADPQIADVDAVSPTRIHIRGKAIGITEVALESEKGEVWRARLEVNADTSRLQGQLRKLFPNSSLIVTQVDDVVVVKGTLPRVEDTAQMRQLFDLAKLQYVDMTTVAGLQQVQLQVKIAEVSRTGLRYLSTDWSFSDLTATLAVNNDASATYQPEDPFPTLGRSLPGGTTIFGTGAAGSTVFEYFLSALTENQYLRILAEPTLVARSGQEAWFLAGGEVPIPIAQVGGGNTTEISIEYKEYGVRLRFTPTVLGDGQIELRVAPEVSQLTDVGSVVLLGSRIPALLTRRVETTLELQSGQTFAIAGLLDQKDNASVSKIPVLGELPVLGTLFRSVRYNREDTEMIVLVTASLVEPSSNDLNPPVPGDFHVDPNDWELYVDGQLEGKHTVTITPTQKERMKRLGLDKLQGPGAWASYEETMPGAAAANGQPAVKKKNEKKK